MKFNSKNSKKQGDIGLGAAIGYFSKNGYVVSISLTDSQEYDLLVDDGNTLYKVQVKTVEHKSKYGIYKCSLTTKGGNRSGYGKIKKITMESFDLLFILTSEFKMYLMPISSIGVKSYISLGKDKQKYLVI